MNFEEIITELKKQEISVEDFAYGNRNVTYDVIGECEEIDSYGGEGEGSDWWRIKFFPEHKVYIKVFGYYSSYNGTDFEGWDDSTKEVVPQQKTITVYE